MGTDGDFDQLDIVSPNMKSAPVLRSSSDGRTRRNLKAVGNEDGSVAVNESIEKGEEYEDQGTVDTASECEDVHDHASIREEDMLDDAGTANDEEDMLDETGTTNHEEDVVEDARTSDESVVVDIQTQRSSRTPKQCIRCRARWFKCVRIHGGDCDRRAGHKEGVRKVDRTQDLKNVNKNVTGLGGSLVKIEGGAPPVCVFTNTSIPGFRVQAGTLISPLVEKKPPWVIYDQC